MKATADNYLKEVAYPDDTGVEYTYDAFRRKTSRTETYYDLKDLDKIQAELEKSNNGKGNDKEKTNNGNASNDKITGKENAITRGNGEKTGLIKQLENPYEDLLTEETTYYTYDGLNVINEFDENGSTLAEYQIANGEVLAKKMFGFHGRKEQGYEGNIQTRGGLMYYQTDDLGNIMDVTDHTGDTVMKYRYDAFGNLFTQMAAPYNTIGYTGKSYDAKASLIDFSARWYSPNYGRFITEDTFLGWIDQPLSLNKYSYVHNNPINFIDKTGHWQEGDENLPPEAQEAIRDLTEEWENATTQEERDAAHEAAEAIRDQYNDGGDSGSSGSGGSGGYTGPTIQELIAQADETLDGTAGEIPDNWELLPGYSNEDLSSIDIEEYIILDLSNPDELDYLYTVDYITFEELLNFVIIDDINELLDGDWGLDDAIAIAGLTPFGKSSKVAKESIENSIDKVDELFDVVSTNTKKIKNNKEANNLAKNLGYDGAEALKEDFVGRSGAKFNITYDNKTGEIILESIKDGIQVPTGLFK